MREDFADARPRILQQAPSYNLGNRGTSLQRPFVLPLLPRRGSLHRADYSSLVLGPGGDPSALIGDKYEPQTAALFRVGVQFPTETISECHPINPKLCGGSLHRVFRTTK
jgi:hypothetical protein